ETEASVRIDVEACTGLRPAVDAASAIGYLPCGGNELLEVSLRTGEILRRLTLELESVQTAVLADGGSLFVGGARGEVLSVDRDAWASSLLHTTPCQEIVRDIAVSRDARRIAPVGDGTGI